MADKYLGIDGNGVTSEVEGTVTSAGAANAGELVALDASGKLDPTVLPSGIGDSSKSIAASENMTAPCLVNIHNSSGQKVRYADASTAAAAKQAMGFIKDTVVAPANVNVYFEGEIPGFVGLTPGVVYFLSDTTPGGVTDTPVTITGRILQRIGVATSDTTIDYEANPPIIRG